MTATDDSEVPSYPDLLRLDGRGCVVVGAGQGIGRQTAHALASVGGRVLCVDVDPARADEIAAEVKGVACVADATTRAGAEQIIAEAKRAFGRLDALVDIVGMARYAKLVDATDEDWDWTFQMVLRHAFLLLQLAGREMAASGGGSIVLVSSISGQTSAPFHGAYGAAKAGLLSLVRTAAVEMGPSNVRVNSVSPGTTLTPRIKQWRADQGTADSITEGSPLGRVNETSDIASAALFLTSDLARMVNGHTIVVDGGALWNYPYPLQAP